MCVQNVLLGKELEAQQTDGMCVFKFLSSALKGKHNWVHLGSPMVPHSYAETDRQTRVYASIHI